MKATIGTFAFLCLLLIGSGAAADIFFEEQFNGPTLDPSYWRTEILTSGARWCDSYPGAWEGPGSWVAEGVECYGVAAHSPYGSASLSDGMIHMSSTNGQACPYLVTRIPGGIPMFPETGDFTLTVRMRYDHVTPWGTFFCVLQSQSSEPVGSTPLAQYEDILLSISPDYLRSALSGQCVVFAMLDAPYELHEFTLECVGNVFTIRVDGQVEYGPIPSALRPTCVYIGNQVLAYWYPTDWQWLSVDYFQVEVPGPVPVAEASWGEIKALYHDGDR